MSSALTGWDFVPHPDSEVCRGLAEGGQRQSWSCSPSVHRFIPPAVVLSGEDIHLIGKPYSTFCTAPELVSDRGRFMVIYKVLCCIFLFILMSGSEGLLLIYNLMKKHLQLLQLFWVWGYDLFQYTGHCLISSFLNLSFWSS